MLTVATFAAAMAFGPAPLTSELERGRKIREKGHPITRNDDEAKVTIGRWFDGSKHVTTEEMVLLTPGLLSRDTGYVASPDDSQLTWSKATAQFGGTRYALIRLARLNPVSIYDGDITEVANPDALNDVKFTWISAKDRKELKTIVVQDRQDRKPKLVLDTDWREVLSSFSAWPSPNKAPKPMYSEIRWGRNRVVSYFTEVPAFEPGEQCSLEIIESDRTRTIKFRCPKL